MTLSIGQMRTPFTRSEAMDWLLQVLQSLGFETSRWEQEGRIQAALMSAVAATVSDLSEIVSDLVEMGFNDLATGEGLSLFSKSRFDNERRRATRTIYHLELVSKSTIPYEIKPGQLLAATDDRVQFRNLGSGTLSPGGTLSMLWEAVRAGDGGNVGRDQVTRLLTSLAGVTLRGAASVDGERTGADEETDDHLRFRNRTKWSTLNPLTLTADAARNIALSNGAEKVALHDRNPRGPFTANVYVAGARARLGDEDMLTIQQAFSRRTYTTSTKWPAEDVVLPFDRGTTPSTIAVLHPPEFPLDLTVTLFCDSSVKPDEVLENATTALLDYLRRTPIGGYSYPPNFYNVVPSGDLSEALENVHGVQTAIFQGLPQVTLLNPLALVTPGTWSINVVPVAVTA